MHGLAKNCALKINGALVQLAPCHLYAKFRRDIQYGGPSMTIYWQSPINFLTSRCNFPCAALRPTIVAGKGGLQRRLPSVWRYPADRLVRRIYWYKLCCGGGKYAMPLSAPGILSVDGGSCNNSARASADAGIRVAAASVWPGADAELAQPVRIGWWGRSYTGVMLV